MPTELPPLVERNDANIYQPENSIKSDARLTSKAFFFFFFSS
jgi:hypothetical protein